MWGMACSMAYTLATGYSFPLELHWVLVLRSELVWGCRLASSVIAR